MEVKEKSIEDTNINISEKKDEFSSINNISNIENKEQTNMLINETNKTNDNEKVEKEQNNLIINKNTNSTPNNEKEKRFRRGKNETTDRIYKCPDCDKSYLSGPALTIHRKMKHNFNRGNDNKPRGRPKREPQYENFLYIAQNHYNNFLNNENRKPLISENGNHNNEGSLDQIKAIMINIFKEYKSDLFPNIDNIENYSFYKLIIENWNKKIEVNMESFRDNYFNSEKIVNYSKYNSLSLDYILLLYLKELSTITNNEYFLFINKFVIFLREWINALKKEIIKDEYKTEFKKEYSQLFSAETIPDYCNDFFIDIMEPKQFFGLKNEEFIELAQHFCFWLYLKKYSPNYIIPLKKN